jgi:hypothetical protein
MGTISGIAVEVLTGGTDITDRGIALEVLIEGTDIADSRARVQAMKQKNREGKSDDYV